ncbi:unnamed protein product [Macrosiphum euphorbiae]|uniref:P2X purinoreceptor 7 intracellular domain-containing protein n=1 Tax=Macrosiphum euphorbiae TaxID=13131 RepID=A0AAV0WB73_9HEMI|nr:unnamed protein product [Macrosiphum euphorbiae]
MTSAYLFEPEYENDDEIDTVLEYHGIQYVNYENRSGTRNWCSCEKCVVMTTDQESMCCQEYDKIKHLAGNYECITQNNLFEKLVLDKDVLTITRHQLILKSKNKTKRQLLSVDEAENKLWRYLAYKNFTSWINAWTTIGKGNRVVIPSCSIAKIRSVFPEKNGVYVGFRPSEKNPD